MTVLVQGPAECLNGHEVHRLTHRPDRWGAGLQWLHVRISPRSVTGRRYPGDSQEPRTRPAHFPSQLLPSNEAR